MCDTLCKQVKGQNFFAKNSDRDYGEPQYIHYAILGNEHFDTIPEYKYEYQEVSLPLLEKLKSGYPCNIPALLSRPSWLWGAEIGINIHGVAIGNEAVFTLRTAQRKGILGMDLLRLALHNATSAYEALQLLSTWIENIPQGGNGSYTSSLFYNNSFIIKDPDDAYILETAGYKYVWKKIRTTEAISNNYSLYDGDEANRPEKSLIPNASPFHAFFTKGKYRRNSNQNFLSKDIDLLKLMQQMRSHGESDIIHSSMKGICLHAKGIASTTTTASWIIDYNLKIPVIWYMPHAHPCVGKYLPIPLEEATLLQYNTISTQLESYLRATEQAQYHIQHYNNFRENIRPKIISEQNLLVQRITHTYNI